MRYRILSLILILFAVAGSALAQNISKTGVVKMSLRSSGPILSEGQVKGYYFFYNLERKDKKNSNYLLSVYDENLREINSINIVRPTNYVLVDGAFNESLFAFVFYDLKSKTIEVIGYDASLKQIGSKTAAVKNKVAQSTFTNIANGVTASQSFLVPVKNKGFLYYGLDAVSDYKYRIQFFDNTLTEVWAKSAPAKGSAVEVGTEAFQSGDYVGSLIVKKKTMSSKDLDAELLVQKISDGSILFQVPMESGPYSISFSDISFDETKQNFVVFGEYFDKKEKEMKAQSLGFIHLTLDMTGKIVGEKRNSWAADISRVTPMNEKGKFEGLNASILVHDIIRTDDGQIFVVGEQYKKAASGAGIASQVLMVAAAAASGGGYYGSSASSTQLNVYNMVIFQFNPDYTINKVHVFEKDKNVVVLPSGSTYLSSKTLSYYAKAIGGFDFTFSQVSPDKSTFSVAYINYDRNQPAKSKNVLGVVVYTPEKVFVVDKLPMTRKSTEYFVYRAKDGYVLITEYFKKEKKVDTRLEKINF